eukprot:7025891-Alexandrium_andersonii.AAC.1
MSASLVGSEMCIRDRPLPSASFHPHFRLWETLRLRNTGLHDREGGRAPVSYTHLTLPTICSV